MNVVNILIQSKDDLKNLLDSEEKVNALTEGLTIVFIEAGTQKGQLAIELIVKGQDVYGKQTVIGFSITESNFESIIGTFIGARMRFGRMPEDQWEIVRHYVKDQVSRFIDTLDVGKRELIEQSLRKFFRC